MRKVVILFLLLVILACTAFIILRLAAGGSENNFFNRNYRLRFSENEFMRKVLALHNDGDARSDYLGNKYSEIVIEVDEMQGLNLPKDSLDLLAKNIGGITGKKVSYVISDTNIQPIDNVAISDVDIIAQKYRNFFNHGSTAAIYLLYLNGFANESDLAGSTYDNFGMMLFATPLSGIGQQNNSVFDNYVEATALHEFGHQLGLPHNNFSDCLMQAYVDQSLSGRISPDAVITNFCNYEKNQINSIRSKL